MTSRDPRLKLQGPVVRIKVSAEVHDHRVRSKDRVWSEWVDNWSSAAAGSRSVDPSRESRAGFSRCYPSPSHFCSEDDVAGTIASLATSALEPSPQEPRMLAGERPGSARAQCSTGPTWASDDESEFSKMSWETAAEDFEKPKEKVQQAGPREDEPDAANERRSQIGHRHGCDLRHEVSDGLFEAKLFHRIGLKDDANDCCGDCLTNVTHVCHVYKGVLALTDVLRGTVSFAAPTARLVHALLTKPGSEPWCACVAPSGHLAVTFRRLGCVAVWSDKGSLVREFGYGVLTCPTGIACDRRGRFAVTDDKSNLVALFTPSGEFIKYLTGPGRTQSSKDRSSDEEVRNVSKDKDDERDHPPVLSGDRDRKTASGTVATTTDTSFDMPNTVKNRAGTLKDRPGTVKDRPGTFEDRPGMDDWNNDVAMHEPFDVGIKREADDAPHVFSQPRYVCVAPSGKIVISDSGSHSLKIFDSDGHFLRAVGGFGSGDGQLKAPHGVCCDQNDNIFVADYYNDRVSVFSIEGKFLQNLLTSSSGLFRPKSVALRPAHDRKLYVAHGGLRSTEVLMYRLLGKNGGRQAVTLRLDF